MAPEIGNCNTAGCADLSAQLQRLRDENALLVSVLDGASDGLLARRADRSLLFNARAARLWGLTPEQAAGMDAAEMADYQAAQLKDPDAYRRLVADLDANPQAERLDVLALRDGRYLERRVRPKLVNGQQDGCVITYRDVTEMVRFADDMAFNARVLENCGPMVWIDRASRSIVFANPAASEHFGYSREEMIGKQVAELDADFTREKERFVVSETREGRIAHFETRHRRKDGAIRDAEVWISLTEHAGRAVYVVSTKDTTDEKRIERELRAAMEATRAATEAKSLFLANMSHEIRTPMNAIIGLCHLLRTSKLAPLQRDYVGKMHAAGQHLLGIINNILDLSKIEAGKLELENGEFDLDRLLRDVTTMIEPAAGDKGLELVLEADPDVPRRLIGDKLRLGQILLNFANNAVKFTAAGEVCILVRRVAGGDGDDSVLMRFEVRDTGIGMSESDLARLFQPFTQADASITRQHGGTGLGLVIAKKLAELMGGTVGVESALGTGSCFWFTARLKPAEQRVFEVDPRLRGSRALVVDDSFEARAAIADMLTGMSMHVAETGDGAEAIDLVRSSAADAMPFEIVFIDCRMPGLDGFDVAQRIRALGLDPAPTLVMVTAYAREDVLQRAAERGVQRVLVKPVQPSLLFDTTMELLSRARSVAPTQRAPRETEEGAAPPAALAAIRGRHVLLVEDNDINQLVATAMLEEAGLLVDVAENGAIAVDKACTGHYDLVFMDMQMPVMDGLTATRQLRQMGVTRPILAMTANALERDRQLCVQAGMDDVLTKPIDPCLLWDALLRWLRRPGHSATQREGAEPGEAAGAAPAPVSRGKDEPWREALLERFVRSHAQVPGEIRDALANGDVARAESLAQGLKSIALDLGLDGVNRSAGALETALQNYEPPAWVQSRLDAVAHSVERALLSAGERLASPAA